MSKINGEKARASIESRRRTAQREKDRAKRAAMGNKPVAHPEPKVHPEPKKRAAK
ncbi:MAG: hypothetical protein QOE82_559 [Thermoanaerobaculia bacterium]|jgi:hypothetical protein|nr:hypothetical protein [Thermoanaerobaculia bacterium]